MAETVNKPKLKLRSMGGSFGVDRTPSPATKLLINHGKPNFTIQRLMKTQQNGTIDEEKMFPTSEQNNSTFNNDNSNILNNNVKEDNNLNGNSVRNFTGTRKLIAPSSNGSNPNESENEASKVVLRRTKTSEPPLRDGEDETVPEFIRRQRRIQERLAKENILDFESRRSGYFTHVMISPTATTANRTSFVETMSSPAVVPALEIPPPVIPPLATKEEECTAAAAPVTGLNNNDDNEAATTKPDEQLYEEEVAKAIDEVNKAVAGEDVECDNMPLPVTEVHAHDVEVQQEDVEKSSHTQQVLENSFLLGSIVEEEKCTNDEYIIHNGMETSKVVQEPVSDPSCELAKTVELHVEQPTVMEVGAKQTVELITPIENGHVLQEKVELTQNGHAVENASSTNEVTISHTNGLDGPRIPAPDPSGVLGVNFEPKTVVSFSKDLGSEPNKYPDVVKFTNETTNEMDEQLKELSKLKFEINANSVKPVLRVE